MIDKARRRWRLSALRSPLARAIVIAMNISIATLPVLFAALPAVAQIHGGSHGAAHHSPYTGEEKREIKALSEQEQRGWLEGQGMGLARAAELNGYPGPMHVLELADKLHLSSQQVSATHELMHRHKAEVRALGEQIVDAERELDSMFKSKRATDADVEHLTTKIGTLQARIRTSHLQTHLFQTTLMTPEQVALYSTLRGYR